MDENNIRELFHWFWVLSVWWPPSFHISVISVGYWPLSVSLWECRDVMRFPSARKDEEWPQPDWWFLSSVFVGAC